MVQSQIWPLFLVLSFVSHTIGDGDKKEAVQNDYKTSQKLVLKEFQIARSRWVLEQFKKTNKTKVYHAFDITDVVRISLEEKSLRVEFHVMQRWEADSLEIPEGLFKPADSDDVYFTTDEDILKTLWSPDSFIPNARDSKIQSSTSTHAKVDIYKNKTIVYRARMYVVLGCSFTFQWYPLDVQVCDLIFESHKYTRDVVEYDWETNLDPVIFSGKISLYQYNIITPPRKAKGFYDRWGAKSRYPYVKITFRFERKLGNDIIQVFTPSILVVTLSFFSFWMGLDVVPGRITLLITCILTLVTMHSNLKGTIPPVHYIKMMDIWMVGCLAFVFGATFEIVVVKYMLFIETTLKNLDYTIPKPCCGMLKVESSVSILSEVATRSPANQLLIQRPMGRDSCNAQGDKGIPGRSYPSVSNDMQEDVATKASDVETMKYPQQIFESEVGTKEKPPTNKVPLWVKVEHVCQIVFPLLFCAFNLVYWPILLIGSAEQHRDDKLFQA